MNKRLITKLSLVLMMIAVLTFFTACTFASSNIDLGVAQLGDGIRTVFDSLVNGVVAVVRGVFEGLWEFIVGLFNIIIGAIAWVWEFIVGLF
ncbi:MAG: hypothetical protein IJP20_02765 [Clostridia bacterium]|nr:hypothetical protein [Clostridia bacterium]